MFLIFLSEILGVKPVILRVWYNGIVQGWTVQIIATVGVIFIPLIKLQIYFKILFPLPPPPLSKHKSYISLAVV